MKTKNLIGLSIPELEKLAENLGERAFKGRQIFKWVYSRRQYDPSLMTDLSLEMRSKLEKLVSVSRIKLADRVESKDGTVKYLFELSDGLLIETVMIPADGGRATVCLSSQVGCALACRFCATGTMGLSRDLTAGEILDQLLFLRDESGDDAFSNVVFMGMGEPLLNFGNVVKAIEIMVHQLGLRIPARKITVSTSGVSPKIKKLADIEPKIGLAISLHAARQDKRAAIMSVADTFKLPGLMDAIRYFAQKKKTSITFEYILFKGVNDSVADVRGLVELIGNLKCKINVLAYNPVKGLDFERPDDETVDWFGGQLNRYFPTVTVRKSRGLDISAACGQLVVQKSTVRVLDASKN